MEIVTPKRIEKTTRRWIDVQRLDENGRSTGAGWSFNLTQDDDLVCLIEAESGDGAMGPAGCDNLCMTLMPDDHNRRPEWASPAPMGPTRIVVEDHTSTFTVSAVGKCDCGRSVRLSHFTNACACGRDYDYSGSLLAPRSQWGEDTGEHWSECMGIAIDNPDPMDDPDFDFGEP